MPLHITLGARDTIKLHDFILDTRWEQYSGRVESLDLQNGIYFTLEDLGNLFASPLLSLKYLNLCISLDDAQGEPTFFSIPEAMAFPRLIRLHTKASPFPWDHSVYNFIKSLLLEFTVHSHSLFPDASGLAILFSRMKCLEELSIMGYFEIRGISGNTYIAPPPSLKTLHTNSIRCLNAIACISPDHSLAVRIDVPAHGSLVNLAEIAGRFFSRHTRLHLLPTTYSLIHRTSHERHISWYRAQLRRGSDPDASLPCIDISLQHSAPPEWPVLPTAAHLEDITEARIDIGEDKPTPALLDLLLRSPQMRTLRLGGQSLAHLVAEMSLAGNADDAGLLPLLRTIIIHDVAEQDRAAVLKALGPLVVWLECRKECGTLLREIHVARTLVTGQGVLAELMDRLERLVDAVRVV
jgi:hypothetical protein